jgi:hypothetical protein
MLLQAKERQGMQIFPAKKMKDRIQVSAWQ